MSIVWQKWYSFPVSKYHYSHESLYITYSSITTYQPLKPFFWSLDRKKERVLILFCRFNVIVECIQLIYFENIIAECIQLIWFGNEGTSENLIMWSSWNVSDHSMLLTQSHSLKNQKRLSKMTTLLSAKKCLSDNNASILCCYSY